MMAELETGTCLNVYFGFRSYYCNIADSNMSIINKIYRQVLVQLL